jgi:hypothetical protein
VCDLLHFYKLKGRRHQTKVNLPGICEEASLAGPGQLSLYLLSSGLRRGIDPGGIDQLSPNTASAAAAPHSTLRVHWQRQNGAFGVFIGLADARLALADYFDYERSLRDVGCHDSPHYF